MEKPEVKVVSISDEVLDMAFEKAIETIRIARAWICRSAGKSPYPYLAPLAGLLKPVKVIGCDTMAVDKWARLYFNPFFVLFFHKRFPAEITEESLREFLSSYDISDYPINILVEILRHEVEHLFRRHFARAEAFGIPEEESMRKRWNIAADLEINQYINCPPLVSLMFLPEKFSLPTGLSAEEYYTKLPENLEQLLQKEGSGKGVVILAQGHKYPTIADSFDEGGSGAGLPKEYELPPDDKENPGASEAQVQARIEETARQIKEHAKTRGTVPGNLLEVAEQILNPKVNWRKVLAQLIRKAKTAASIGREDYTFKLPNRKSEAYDPFIMPSMVDYTPQDIAVVLDTSGSISKEDYERAVSETLAIARQCNISVDAFLCDAAVHRVIRKVKNFSQLREIVGRGGTNMIEGINRALAERPRKYTAIVVMTDGYSPFPQDPTPIPLIICLVGKNHERKEAMPSWAKVVEVED